ncbi:Uncharacterised protein [Acinetobacter baumannii]|nr:Uncharacterised protein [Acinetobacter baumannii]SMB77319.1 Uncharacterised protein [Acinetobacter baumannii]
MGPFFYLTALALLFSWHIFYIHRFNNPMILFLAGMLVISFMIGEFKHEVRQFQKPYDNQQAEQISLMV